MTVNDMAGTKGKKTIWRQSLIANLDDHIKKRKRKREKSSRVCTVCTYKYIYSPYVGYMCYIALRNGGYRSLYCEVSRSTEGADLR